MFKKTLLATAIVAVSTGIAFANGGTYTPPPPAHTHNVYIGAAVSRDFVHSSINDAVVTSDTFDGIPFTTTDARNVDFGNSGWNGELYAGLGFTFMDHYYLAGEIFGEVNSAKIDDSAATFVSIPSLGVVHAGTGFSTQLDPRWSFGIRAIPGVKISDSTMLYGAVGVIWTQFKNSFSFFDDFHPADDFVFNNNKTKAGLQLGLGLETMITTNVSARIEYDWNRYGNNNSNFVANGNHVTMDQAKLGIAYHFMSA